MSQDEKSQIRLAGQSSSESRTGHGGVSSGRGSARRKDRECFQGQMWGRAGHKSGVAAGQSRAISG